MERKVLTTPASSRGRQRLALKIGAWINLLLAAGHLLCLLDPERIFRLYGIERTMARFAAFAPSLPQWIIVGVASGLLVCALYALAGAGLRLHLPLIRPFILLIGTFFLLRALGGVVLMIHTHTCPATEWSAALIAGTIGVLYLSGGWHPFDKQQA